MRMEGLEPSRGHPRQILSLMRLPFRHIRKSVILNTHISLTYEEVYVNHFFEKYVTVCNSSGSSAHSAVQNV